MTEIRDKRYLPIGEGTHSHIVFRQIFLSAADIAAVGLNTPLDVTSIINDLTANFHGASRQAFKVLIMHDGAGTPTADVEIQEFVPDPHLVDPFFELSAHAGEPHGRWATKGGLGVGVATSNILFEHNSEDTMRWARVLITPRTVLPDVGIRVILEGRRHV